LRWFSILKYDYLITGSIGGKVGVEGFLNVHVYYFFFGRGDLCRFVGTLILRSVAPFVDSEPATNPRHPSG
jgi:hypothetical protein